MIVRRRQQNILPAALSSSNNRAKLTNQIVKNATRDEAGKPIFFHLPGTPEYEGLAKGSQAPVQRELISSPNQGLKVINDDGSSSEGPPPADNDRALFKLANNSPKSNASLLPILVSLGGSTVLAALTHFKEDILGPLTKPIKYISVFAALFSATVGAAIGLTPNNSDTSTTEADYSHAVF